MNRFVYSVGTILAATALRADAASVEQVIVRQQWPWSTDIKVEYKLSGVDIDHPVNLGVRAFSGETEIDGEALAGSIKGDVYGLCESGVGEILIDPKGVFGEGRVALNDFKVQLFLTPSDSNAGEVIYKIFDLTADSGTFPCNDVTRADIVNGHYGSFERDFADIGDGFSTSLSDVLIWTGVTNDVAYSTTKLVMRKIPAGVFSMGQTGIEDKPHEVTLTKDFWIGVFPVTQMQYKKLTRNPNWPISAGNESHPIVGGLANATYEIYQNIVTNKITEYLGMAVNYPTEAQWEYACRAGTTSDLYTGKPLSSANLDPIAWFNGESSHKEVGLKLPNAYGLYDMSGNVYDACRDAYKANESAPGYSDGNAQEDPEAPGPESGNNYVARGGYYGIGGNARTTSAGRASSKGDWAAFGFRLAFTAE